jgi:hypothetical protein
MRDETVLPQQPFHRVVDRVRGLAVAFCGGRLSEQEFVQELLTLEDRAVSPAGLTLSVCDTEDDWTSVLIKSSASGKLHAAFEFLPEAARFRPLRHLTQYAAYSRLQ